MDAVYTVIGIIVFWVFVAISSIIAIIFLAGVWYHKIYRTTYLFEFISYVQFWYKWEYKKTSYSVIENWRSIEIAFDYLVNQDKKYLFRYRIIKVLNEMLASDEYKKYQKDTIK